MAANNTDTVPVLTELEIYYKRKILGTQVTNVMNIKKEKQKQVSKWQSLKLKLIWTKKGFFEEMTLLSILSKYIRFYSFIDFKILGTEIIKLYRWL